VRPVLFKERLSSFWSLLAFSIVLAQLKQKVGAFSNSSQSWAME
jgi:hypothetical protein